MVDKINAALAAEVVIIFAVLVFAVGFCCGKRKGRKQAMVSKKLTLASPTAPFLPLRPIEPVAPLLPVRPMQITKVSSLLRSSPPSVNNCAFMVAEI